ncbi:PKD domain-containing protein [Cohnella nanjingensis]|uniref:PKD domain-containing protein n=1 Tax=Cohnella nanjingensis TaxID=1387779 RepID=A0A7X0RNH1_9BACL|nr:PKD domain-containing protein [Cohnella nanjingensis]MBB6669319.1 PKD domain-containing protein [Cohnella nanjingensis]
MSNHETVNASQAKSLYDGLQDPQFQTPYVDVDEWREVPVRHRYIHGGFEGTETRFSFYFPTKEEYKGRFFQPVYPVQGSENASQSHIDGVDNKIGFAISSRSYMVETNMGGATSDITLVYRASAAVAHYSRVKAAELYGPHRPYGYIYGGSGGGFKTISFMENTTGVWDGAVPFVIGTPMAIPNVFTARVHAMRILWDKFPAILDAIEAGGSGDMYAGLNEEEHQTLEEVTKMGFPPKAWFAYKEIGDGALTVLTPAVMNMDPSYFEEFWTVPGYLGSDPASSASSARLQFYTVIKDVVWPREQASSESDGGSANMGVDEAWKMLMEAEGSIPSFRLANAPVGDAYLQGAFIRITSGEASGLKIPLGSIDGDVVTIGSALGFYTSVQSLAKVKPGDKIVLDNSDYIALQTYHRHQVPTPDYYVWDQFRNESGEPMYPQRAIQVGPMVTYGGAGSLQSGRYEGKMIVVQTLMDESAFPWQADWYRTKVQEHLGEQLDDRFRLWYVDHALHADTSSNGVLDALHIVTYVPALHQALLDLSDWVERGVIPPANTQYEVIDGQVVVPSTASERQGIQPVIHLTVNGSDRTDVAAGETVSFRAVIEVPSNTGKIVSAEWDFEGEATFPTEGSIIYGNEEGSKAVVEATYSFSKPGTYFPVLRAGSSRNGDRNDLFTRVVNLRRVRVVVG